MELQVDERLILLRSAEPPSWIQFFAEAPWWVKALGAYAALYVAEITKEAGRDTWRNRAKVASAAIGSKNQIARFARGLLKLKARVAPRTKLVLGLPIPDDYFGVRFELVGRDEDLLAAEIALFARYVPAIERLIEAEGLRYGRVTGAVMLTIGDDTSLRVTWMDRERLEVEERVLRLDDEA
jgi:hypothetical protein